MRPLRVLFVDDDPIAPAPFAFKLEQRGHTVRILDEPVDVWEVYGPFGPDILILDLVFMKSSCRYGLWLYRDLRDALWKQNELIAPTLILTGLDTPEDRAEAEAIGIAGFLVKPISIDDFLDAFDQLARRIQRPGLRLVGG